MARRHRLILAWIVALALGLRALYAVLVWTPAFTSPDRSMSKMYVRSAYLMAAGHGYAQVLGNCPARTDVMVLQEETRSGRTITPADGARIRPEGLYPEMLHPPGWSWIAAQLHGLTGQPVWLLMQVVGVVVDTLTVLLVFAVVRLCWGGFRLAAWTALLYAIFPGNLAVSVELTPTVFTLHFAVLVTLLLALAARGAGRQRWAFVVLAGLASGLSGYFRPDYLLLAPFLALGLWIVWKRLVAAMAAGLAVAVISLVVMLPWAWRNHGICGRWVFTSSSVGCTLVTGLGTYPNPWGLGPSDVDRGREAAAQGYATAFGPEADPYFRKVFWDCVKSHPRALVPILARRALEALLPPHSWGLARTGSQPFSEIRRQGRIFDSAGYMVRTYWSQGLSAGLMGLGWIGCAGLLLRERKAHPLIVLPLLAPVYAALSHLPTHMAGYYVLPGAFAQWMGLAWLAGRLAGRWRADRKGAE